MATWDTLLTVLPDFPADTRFFVYPTGEFWRATRPYCANVSGQPGAWDVYRDGRIIQHLITYEDFCTRQCDELVRDDALRLFQSACSTDMRLPEGF